MKDTPYSEQIESYFHGRLAKIVFISEDRKTIHVRVDNGVTSRMTLREITDFEQDDVIILNDESIEFAPKELWSEITTVGIVRKILKDQLLVESNLMLRLIPYAVEILRYAKDIQFLFMRPA